MIMAIQMRTIMRGMIITNLMTTITPTTMITIISTIMRMTMPLRAT